MTAFCGAQRDRRYWLSWLCRPPSPDACCAILESREDMQGTESGGISLSVWPALLVVLSVDKNAWNWILFHAAPASPSMLSLSIPRGVLGVYRYFILGRLLGQIRSGLGRREYEGIPAEMGRHRPARA